jgi:hypothetical protein
MFHSDNVDMVIFVLVIACAPTGAIFALRAYLKFHPPDSSEEGIRSLQRGLGLGAASSAAILLLVILNFLFLAYCRPIPPLTRTLGVLFALVATGVNLAGLIDCLRELSGQSLIAALLIILTQLLWILHGFAALMG